MFIFFSQAAIKQFHSLQVLFTGLLYLVLKVLRQFAAIVLINPVSGYTCIIHNMYICIFRFGQRFSPIRKRKCLVIRQFFLAEITFARKKISAHENRIFIHIASPLKKKTHHHWSYNRPWGTAEGGGLEVFFWGGGSTWFSGRTKWASVVANRVKKVEL